jgi:hypothetical protein
MYHWVQPRTIEADSPFPKALSRMGRGEEAIGTDPRLVSWESPHDAAICIPLRSDDSRSTTPWNRQLDLRGNPNL